MNVQVLNKEDAAAQLKELSKSGYSLCLSTAYEVEEPEDHRGMTADRALDLLQQKKTVYAVLDSFTPDIAIRHRQGEFTFFQPDPEPSVLRVMLAAAK